MANTTFNGPVRSQNGFEDISVASGTGIQTTNSTYGNNASIGGTLKAKRSVVKTWEATAAVSDTLSIADSGLLF